MMMKKTYAKKGFKFGTLILALAILSMTTVQAANDYAPMNDHSYTDKQNSHGDQHHDDHGDNTTEKDIPTYMPSEDDDHSYTDDHDDLNFDMDDDYAAPEIEKNLSSQEKTTQTRANDTSVQTVIIPSRKAMYSSPMRGKITTLPYEEGDVFEKGSTLVAYDCKIEKAILREKDASKNAAWAEYKSKKQLKELNSASELEVTLSLMEFRKTSAAVEISQERMKNCAIKSPFDGRVIERKVNLYETVKEGQELIYIVATDKMHARLLVPSQWLSWLTMGTELSIDIQEYAETYPAKIIRIGGAVDEVSQSIPVIAEISHNTKNLLPGMSGIATFNHSNE